MNKIFEVSSSGTVMTVYDECVTFNGKGIMGTAKRHAGEKKVYYRDILSVTFKTPGTFTSGFIELNVKGAYQAKQGDGPVGGFHNDHRYTFNHKQLKLCRDIKSYIEERVNENQKQPAVAPQVQTIDDAQILRNFKSLLDEGIITQEEFDAKKKQILGV